MSSFPVIIGPSGPQSTPPIDLLNALISAVAATNPGYTANLPGSMVEDISSTDVGALVICDQARVETINSLTPFGANAFTLNQLGQIYGVQLGAATNTSVFAVFSGSVGFVIVAGFTISDGTYQYIVQDGGVIAISGNSQPLFCLATQSGSWAVPSGTVTNLVTSVPSTVMLSVTNPEPGIPGAGAQTEEAYRTQVLQAGLAASQGMARYLKTLLQNVLGVQARLVSVLQINGGGWEVICGGGDPYEIAYAIYTAMFDISTLVGSTLGIIEITRANPGQVTTNLNHGLTVGESIVITGVVGMIEVNGTPTTVTGVIDGHNFTIGNTATFSPYSSGGVILPNPRNITVNLNDYPDVYTITYVNPPAQTVGIALTWNTTATNFVSSDAVAQLGVPALVTYVNSLPVGVPINLFELQTTFQTAITPILNPQSLTRMVFAVSINGVGVSPTSGTGIIAGDPESYFLTDSSKITITQG